MLGLCFLLAHSQRWNLTSLIFIPLDLAGLVASLWLILSAIAFAVVVSLAAGLYPATRAARLNPVEALRYE